MVSYQKGPRLVVWSLNLPGLTITLQHYFLAHLSALCHPSQEKRHLCTHNIQHMEGETLLEEYFLEGTNLIEAW